MVLAIIKVIRARYVDWLRTDEANAISIVLANSTLPLPSAADWFNSLLDTYRRPIHIFLARESGRVAGECSGRGFVKCRISRHVASWGTQTSKPDSAAPSSVAGWSRSRWWQTSTRLMPRLKKKEEAYQHYTMSRRSFSYVAGELLADSEILDWLWTRNVHKTEILLQIQSRRLQNQFQYQTWSNCEKVNTS